MLRATFLIALFMMLPLPTSSLGQEQTSAEDSTGAQLKVVRLRYAKAVDASNVVAQLVEGVRLSIDQPTNSIILTGTKEDIDMVFDVVKCIDVEPPKIHSQDDEYFVAYNLQTPEKTKQTFEVLQSLYSGQNNLRMDIDQNDSKLYIYGRKNHHDIAVNLIDEMSKETKQEQLLENNFHVSVVFVVESSQVDEDDQIELKPIEDPYSEVIQQAKNRGLLSFKKPMVATRVTSLVRSKIQKDFPQYVPRSRSVNVVQSKKKEGYFANSSRTQKNKFSLAVTGNLLQQMNGTFKLETDLLLAVPNADQNNESADLSTSIQMPIDHPVLLSFSTVGGVDSAVILQVSRQ